MSWSRSLLLIVFASLVGIVCSELLCHSIAFRDAAGRTFHRGRLVAITNGRGVYERDLDLQEVRASDLVAVENLRHLARHEQTDPAKVDREFSLLRAQFGDEESFVTAIRASGLSIPSLRERIEDQLRSLEWLEERIAMADRPTDEECRRSYENRRAILVEPTRFRASHIFLAAPAGSSPEVDESKRAQIDILSARLGRGETLPQLAEQSSEDEATKSRGGDLGFFSAVRMPPEFFLEVERLGPGRTSSPFRSHLGFHIVEVTDGRARRELSFDEARGDILLALANQRRALIAGHLADMLNSGVYAGKTEATQN